MPVAPSLLRPNRPSHASVASLADATKLLKTDKMLGVSPASGDVRRVLGWVWPFLTMLDMFDTWYMSFLLSFAWG